MKAIKKRYDPPADKKKEYTYIILILVDRLID
jgi:hypothetical protein